jgi:hypothetical protein
MRAYGQTNEAAAQVRAGMSGRRPWVRLLRLMRRQLDRSVLSWRRHRWPATEPVNVAMHPQVHGPLHARFLSDAIE